MKYKLITPILVLCLGFTFSGCANKEVKQVNKTVKKELSSSNINSKALAIDAYSKK